MAGNVFENLVILLIITYYFSEVPKQGCNMFEKIKNS